MFSPDYNVVAEYILSLTGNLDTPVAWQFIYDPDKKFQGNPTFTATLQTAWPYILDAQEKKFGIFVTVNQTDGHGRKLENVTGLRAFFADWDDIDQPHWPATPHFIVKRSERRGHAYWLINRSTPTYEFAEMQRRISLSTGSDPTIVNLDRVMRVPGTWHFKNASMPEMYQFEYNATQTLGGVYNSAILRQAFQLTPEKEKELFQWLTKSEANKNGIDELEDREQYIAAYKGYLKTCPVAVDGSGTAQQTVISVASVGWDYGLTADTTRELMYENYNERCQPPWVSPADLALFDRCIANAYRYAKNAPGCRTAEAVFKAHIESSFAGNLPEPLEGWEANKKKKPKPGDNTPTISQTIETVADDGSFLQLTITNKTNPWDKARAFVQSRYPQGRIIHTDKTYYTYDGVVWGEKDDDDLDSQVAMFYEHLKLPPTQIKGILDSIRRMSHKAGLELNTWINDGTEATDVVVFKNGYVDLSETSPVLQPHTHQLFTINKLDYNYNPAAQCPTWLTFLQSIWGDDQELKDQLQEWMGYILTKDTSMQKLAVFLGKPRGGKGTITHIVKELVGNFNCAAPVLEDLVDHSIKDAIAPKPLALIPDAHKVHPVKRDGVLSVLKAITGEDPMSYDRKFKKAATSLFMTRFILSANDMPEFIDPSGALAARMLVFPFSQSFAGREDRGLKKKLTAEMEGIAVWALQGLQRLRVNGRFTEAQAGLDILEIIQEDMFPLSPFVTECIDMEPGTRTSLDEIYNVYQSWCNHEGVKFPMTKRVMSSSLGASPLPITRGKMTSGTRPRAFIGCRVNDKWCQLVGNTNVTAFPPIAPPLIVDKGA